MMSRKKPFATKLRMIDDALQKYESMQKGRVVRTHLHGAYLVNNRALTRASANRLSYTARRSQARPQP